MEIDFLFYLGIFGVFLAGFGMGMTFTAWRLGKYISERLEDK